MNRISYFSGSCQPLGSKLFWLITQCNRALAQSLTDAREFFLRESSGAGLSESHALGLGALYDRSPIQLMDLASLQAITDGGQHSSEQVVLRSRAYQLVWSNTPLPQKRDQLLAEYDGLIKYDAKAANQYLTYINVVDKGLAQAMFDALTARPSTGMSVSSPNAPSIPTAETPRNDFVDLFIIAGQYRLTSMLRSNPAQAVEYLQEMVRANMDLAVRMVSDLQQEDPKVVDNLLRETRDRAPQFWNSFTALLQGSRSSQGAGSGFAQVARIHTPVILHTIAPDGSIVRTNELPELGHESIYFAAIKQGGDIPEMIVLPGPGATTLDGRPVRGRITDSPRDALDHAVQTQMGGEGDWAYVRFAIDSNGVVRASRLDEPWRGPLDLPLVQPIADAMQRPIATESGLPYSYPASWVRPLQASGYLDVVSAHAAQGPDELARTALRTLVGAFGVTGARATLRDLAQLPNGDIGMAVAKARFVQAVLPALPEAFAKGLFNDAHSEVVRGAGLSARAQMVLRSMVIALIRDPASLERARANLSRDLGASEFEALEQEIHQWQLNTTGAPSFLNAARMYKELIAGVLLPNLRR
jgi:hypothetical protein